MVVHPDSGRISRVRPYSGNPYRPSRFRLRGSHPLWPSVPGSFVYHDVNRILGSYNTQHEVGFRLFPFRSPLLRESRLISFPLLHEMFQFTGCPPDPKTESGLWAFPHRGFPIRKSSADSARLAADRSLSQLATSFVGMQSRGIHVMRMSNISFLDL